MWSKIFIKRETIFWKKEKKMQKIMRRVMAVVLLAAMVVITIGIVPEEAKAASSYPYKANMQNLLSDYQYVVKENLQVKTHTMGGVAVGGDCELADFADAMVSPSYAKHLVKVGNVKDPDIILRNSTIPAKRRRLSKIIRPQSLSKIHIWI